MMLGRPLRADFKTLRSRAAAGLYSKTFIDQTMETWAVIPDLMGHVDTARRHMWQYLAREGAG